MKTIHIILAFFSFLLLFSACGKNKTGACESKTSYVSGVVYTCYDAQDEDFCDGTNGSITSAVWHSGKTCQELGYTHKNYSTGAYTANSSGSAPGANGAFGSGGGGGGSNCNGGSYNGPEFDIQIDAQCKAAYQYKCAGHQQGVDAACAIYNTYSNVPPCPYCN